MMLQPVIISALLSLVLAIPVPESSNIQARQSINENDIEEGVCRDVTFIFARGSTEIGNMGTIVGPDVCRDLKSQLGSVACQGVGGAYTANLVPNILPANTNVASIREGMKMFRLAAENCPNTKIVAGGYSQGSAVIDNTVQRLDDDLKSMVKGVVLFGFTRNLQDNGQIPDYPEDQVKVFCAVGDLVCSGTLVITPAHLTYGDDADEAADYLVSRV